MVNGWCHEFDRELGEDYNPRFCTREIIMTSPSDAPHDEATLWELSPIAWGLTAVFLAIVLLLPRFSLATAAERAPDSVAAGVFAADVEGGKWVAVDDQLRKVTRRLEDLVASSAGDAWLKVFASAEEAHGKLRGWRDLNPGVPLDSDTHGRELKAQSLQAETSRQRQKMIAAKLPEIQVSHREVQHLLRRGLIGVSKSPLSDVEAQVNQLNSRLDAMLASVEREAESAATKYLSSHPAARP